MDIHVRLIPNDKHRYPTCGDYWVDKTTGDVELRVSQMKDWRMPMLVAVHEIVELLLCKQDGVDYSAIDRFDIAFEKRRKRNDDSEPGDDPKAPYYAQHQFATAIEKLLCERLGVSWADYENAILELFE